MGKKSVFKKSIRSLILPLLYLCLLFGACAFVLTSKTSFSDLIKEPIQDKKISFIGDSITTYEGWSNNTKYNSTIGSNAVWYNSTKLSSVNQTYWKQTIDEFDLDLTVNNAWSGSRVTGTSSSAACQTRATQLHNVDKENPDIIVVYIGINDFDGGVSVGDYSSVKDIYNSSTKTYTGDVSVFSIAYATMVHKIVNKYEEADVYLCTLLPNDRNTDYDTLKVYNSYIKKIGKAFNCNIVDFYNDSGITKDNFTNYCIDGLHPNVSGHKKMASCLQEKLLENYRLKKSIF